MNAERVISKINIEMNAFNESGGREDKACAEGLRRARTYVQQEVLKRKILTHNQQVVLEWFKNRYIDYNERLSTIIYFLTVHYPYGTDEHLSVKLIFRKLSKQEEAQVIQAFATWVLEQEEK